MKKRFCLTSVLLLAVGSVSTLAGCEESGSGEGSTNRTYTYTVRFFDDAPTPVQVGYAYVAEGESVSFVRKMNDADAYDYKTHSGIAVPFGNRCVFDHWAGVYEDSTPVDVTSIQGDCDLYANFVYAHLTYSVVFKNGSDVIDSDNDGAIEWGTFAALPQTAPTKSLWGYDTPFEGYGFESGATEGWNGGLTAKFLHGEGAPDSATKYDEGAAVVSTPTAGSFYEDTSTYDFYGFSGSWKLLGNFEDTLRPQVTYAALFGETLKDMLVTFYDGDPDSGGNVIGSHTFSYSTSITFSADKKSVSGEDSNGAFNLDLTSFLAEKVNYWTGTYSNAADVPERFRGQTVDRADPKAAAPCVLYPVFF